MACIVKPGASLATTATPAGDVGEDQEMRRRLRAFDERQLSRQRVAAHVDPARGRVAVEGAERQRNRSRCPGEDPRAARAPRSRAAPQARGWPRPRRAAAPGRRRGPAPRTRGRFRAIRPRRHWNRATQDPAGPWPATASQSPRRCRNSPRPCRPAKCSTRKSRTDLRSRLRSASDTPSMSGL